jgi:hypothetical protein
METAKISPLNQEKDWREYQDINVDPFSTENGELAPKPKTMSQEATKALLAKIKRFQRAHEIAA